MGTPVIRSVLRHIHDQVVEPEGSIRIACAERRVPEPRITFMEEIVAPAPAPAPEAPRVLN